MSLHWSTILWKELINCWIQCFQHSIKHRANGSNIARLNDELRSNIHESIFIILCVCVWVRRWSCLSFVFMLFYLSAVAAYVRRQNLLTRNMDWRKPPPPLPIHRHIRCATGRFLLLLRGFRPQFMYLLFRLQCSFGFFSLMFYDMFEPNSTHTFTYSDSHEASDCSKSHRFEIKIIIMKREKRRSTSTGAPLFSRPCGDTRPERSAISAGYK